MKITIQATVQESQYDWENGVNKEVSLTTESESAHLLPWAQICEGLVEKTIAQFKMEKHRKAIADED